MRGAAREDPYFVLGLAPTSRRRSGFRGLSSVTPRGITRETATVPLWTESGAVVKV
jgi:hypothetical protein